MPGTEARSQARLGDAEEENAAINEQKSRADKAAGVKCILLDIEGTICPISFVKATLFPYALKALPDVLATKWNDEDFRPYRDAFPEHARSSPQTLQAYVEQLTKDDVKVACHKNLQGYLWETGYKTGAYSTPLFQDVAPKLKRWKDEGLKLSIYSSGSVFAQKLLFGHVQVQDPSVNQERTGNDAATGTKRSIDDAAGSTNSETAIEERASKAARKIASSETDTGGSSDSNDASDNARNHTAATEDLQYLISDWFDTTNAGPKKEASSYQKIAEDLKLFPKEILFFTDSVEECDASTAAGFRAGLLVRPGNPLLRQEDVDRLKTMSSLEDVDVSHGIDHTKKTPGTPA